MFRMSTWRTGSQTSWKYRLNRRTRNHPTGVNLEVALAQIFNPKLGSFVSKQFNCIVQKRPLLELKIRPRFCPAGWSLSAAKCRHLHKLADASFSIWQRASTLFPRHLHRVTIYLCILSINWNGNRKLCFFLSPSLQGILKVEVSLYHWPPVWLVWNLLYDN